MSSLASPTQYSAPGASLWSDGVTLGQGTAVAPTPRMGRKRDLEKIQGNTLKLKAGLQANSKREVPLMTHSVT